MQVLSAKGREVVDMALKADLVILNTAVAGKWLDAVLQDNVPRVLPKVLWWIHEMRGHYFKLEYVKHLPFVAGAMIDSHATAEYWKNRTHERLGYATLQYMVFMILFVLIHFGAHSRQLYKHEWSCRVMTKLMLDSFEVHNKFSAENSIAFPVFNIVMSFIEVLIGALLLNYIATQI